MTLLILCVFCFVFALTYSSTTAQGIRVCVSFGGPESTEPFINVNWTFSDNEVNILFEDRIGITNRVYDETGAVGIPLRLNFGQTVVNVTVCRLHNTSSCRSLITATTPIYHVTWRRVNNSTLEFTCELACRTPAIFGCSVNLVNSDSSKTLSNFSTILSGTDEAISSRFVIILMNSVDPTAEYTFVATPQASVNGIITSFNGIRGIIPSAEVQVSSTIEQMSTTLIHTTSTDISTTTSSTPPTSRIISSSIASTPSSSVMPGATDDISTTTSSTPPTSRIISSSIAPTPSSSVMPGATDVVSSSDNNDNSASAAVISGAIVGTLLLIIVIIIIIIMIMLLYRGRKNSMKARNIDDKHNPPRNTSDQSQHDHTNNNASSQLRVDLEIVNALYIPTNVKYPEQHGHDKSRGDMIGRDVIITPNPSYITSPKSLQTEKQSEYSYAYVQVDKLVQHNKLLESTTSKITDPAGDDVKVDPNPSYYPLQLDDNPSYHKLHLRL